MSQFISTTPLYFIPFVGLINAIIFIKKLIVNIFSNFFAMLF
ncbi:Hypothetical membrane protein [Ligilactobacillus ruminis ATCC 27782]|uniref:Hypothetical membrane protein n=1 Tax=Ligilactobacillus ruminis (strain ATCC 27782 / RF3) TaxID=1069534 RepID=G2SRY0_LIGR2|nr:Hypothetical membrane protein [Ligilactobacillus ruminis ATCC 27782]